MSSEIIFGAAALARVDQATADRALDHLLEYGVNHIDAAPRYGDAELLIGPWMDRYRKDFFLATKIGVRDYAGAKDSIRTSLDRLRTDHVDLIQLHALYHPDEWEQALSPGGALDAAIEAREQGLVRYIGVTGHGWTIAAMHRRSLERFDFDSVLMPLNWFTATHETYAADFEATAAMCAERNVAVQTIKSLARGAWPSKMARRRNTWYEPLEAEEDIQTAIDWTLGREGIFVVSTGDVGLLPTILRAAARRGEMPDDEFMNAFGERVGLASIFGL
ncbi:MAG: aldo/keto reductase [Rhodospirillales bacterium]|nr:aldo/keto reductase [Rhodospirillales bacterium]